MHVGKRFASGYIGHLLLLSSGSGQTANGGVLPEEPRHCPSHPMSGEMLFFLFQIPFLCAQRLPVVASLSRVVLKMTPTSPRTGRRVSVQYATKDTCFPSAGLLPGQMDSDPVVDSLRLSVR